MRIKTEDLRHVATRLFDHLEELGHNEVTVEHDFYWHVPKQSVYDQYERPTEDMDIGQLSEDWERLEAILAERSPPVAAALAWYAAVLRAIADETVG